MVLLYEAGNQIVLKTPSQEACGKERPDSACPHLANLATMVAEMRHIRKRLDTGDEQFKRVEETLARLEKAENQIIGGYQFFRVILAILGTIAAILTIPHIDSLFK